MRDYKSDYGREALAGREFFLKAKLVNGGDVQVTANRLATVVGQALGWRGKAVWAQINDHRGKVILSRKTIGHLWAVEEGRYGIASEQKPFEIHGPTINPEFFETYYSPDLLGAIDFAVGWLGWMGDDPYWAVIRSPNGRTILSRHTLERMYYAEVHANGRSITISLVRPSDKVLVGKGYSIRLPEVLWTKQVA